MVTLDREALLQALEAAVPRPGRDEIELSFWGGTHRRITLVDGDLRDVQLHDAMFAQARSVRAEGPWIRMGTMQTDDLSPAGLAAATRQAQAQRPTGTRVSGPEGVAISGHYASTAQTLLGARDLATAQAGPGLLLNLLAPFAYQTWRDPDWRISARLDVWHGAFDIDGSPEIAAVCNTWGVRSAHLGTAVRLEVTASYRLQPPVTIRVEDRALASIDTTSLLQDALCLARAVSATDDAADEATDALPVVLMPGAVAAVVRATLPAFSRRLVEAGTSWISPRLRVPLAAPTLDLTVDPTDPLVLQRPFDGEGVPSRPCTLIARGAQAELIVGRGELEDAHRSDGYSPAHPTLSPPLPWTAVLRASGPAETLTPRQFADAQGSHIRVLDLQDVHQPLLGVPDLVARTAGVFLFHGPTCVRRLPDRVVVWNGFAVLRRAAAGSAPTFVQRMAVPALLLEGPWVRMEAPRP